MTLQGPSGFPEPLAYPFVASRDEGGVPTASDKRAGVRGNSRSGGKLQTRESEWWYFPGLGKEHWEQEGVVHLGRVGGPLSPL